MPDDAEPGFENLGDEVEAWLRCRESNLRGLTILETPSDRPAHPDFIRRVREAITREYGDPESA